MTRRCRACTPSSRSRGPDDVSADRPRVDPRHDGQRRADHQDAPAVGRRDHLRRRPRGRDLPAGRRRADAAPPRRPRASRSSPRPAPGRLRAAARPRRRRSSPPPQPAVQRRRRAARRCAALSRGAGASLEAEVDGRRHARRRGSDDLPRRRHRHARVLSTPRARRRHGAGTGMLLRRHRRWRCWRARHVRRHRDGRRRREGGLRGLADGRQGSQELPLEAPLARHRTCWCSAASLGAIALAYMGLKRRGKTQPELHHRLRGRRRRSGRSRSSCRRRRTRWWRRTGGDYVVNVTPRMGGEVVVDNQSYPLQQFVQQRGSQLLAAAERLAPASIAARPPSCSTATPRPRVLEVPFLTWRWNEQVYTVGSAVGLLLFLLMIFSVPPDPKSLSLDLFNSDNRFVKFLIKPPEEKEEDIPEWLKSKKPRRAGRQGQAPQGRRRQDGQEDLQEQGGSVRPEGSEGQPRSAPGQEAGRGAGQERRHPRRPEA